MLYVPPFSLLGRVIQKIEQEKVEAVVIAPVWTTQSWFTKLLNVISEDSFILPKMQNLLTLPGNPEKQHPLKK